MNVDEIKRIIVDQRAAIEEKFIFENIIEREFLEYCRKFIAHPNVFVLSGIRRSGKSVFSCLLVRGESFAYINFDDERLYGFEAKELNNVLEAFYGLYGDINYLILDEIQNVKGWELFVNRLRINKKVIVTGSNANMLSKELATYLTGRYVDFKVYPFSFREFLKYKNIEPDIYSTRSIAGIKNLLNDYIKTGGFPEVYSFGERFLISLYESIITKDVVLRYKIRYVKALKDMARLMITNYSSEVTFNKIKNILDVKSVHTVKNYFEYIESAFLIIKLERFSFKLKEQILAPKKVYVIDTGLIYSIGFQTGENKGKIIENVVAVELLRRKSHNPLIEVYYWKDHQQNEVDFVIKEKSKISQLIQVCYDIDDFKTKERELKGIKKASTELRCKNLLVITWEYEGEEESSEGNIVYKPLWKWLLQNPFPQPERS